MLSWAAPSAAQQNYLLVQWGSDATEYRGQNGRRITVICPSGGHAGDVYGTDVYTDDSLICPAAVHAGLISFVSGGAVTFIVAPGESVYRGLARHGVSSRAFGSWHGSYRFDREGGAGQIDWKTTARGLTTAIAGPLTLICPANGGLETVWGTDTYTDDSSICTAAVHAGVISVEAGGAVALQPVGAVQSYVASSRNGVLSREYGARPNAFSVSGGVVTATVPVGEAATPVVAAPAAAAPTPAVAASSRAGQTAAARAPMPTTGASAGTSRVTTARTANAPIARSEGTGATPSSVGAMQQPTSVPIGRPPARAQAEARAGMRASASLPSDPPAVHATGFTAFAGYGRIVLKWKPVNGALGYRLARASWDPAKNAWIQGSEVEIPTEPVSANSRVFKQFWKNDGGTDAFDRPTPWTLYSESTYVSPALGLKSDTVITRDGPSWLRKVITVISPAGLIADTTFTDVSVSPGTQYVYWLDTQFRSGSGSFYAPNTTPYPTVTAVPRDPALMTWLPSESDLLTAPALLRLTPDSAGVVVQWLAKGGAIGYLVMRTPIGDMLLPRKDGTQYEAAPTLQPGGQCYPYIARAYVQTSSSFNVDFYDHRVNPRFCIGIFAIYPNMLADGTPTADVSWDPSAFLKHLELLVRQIHSDGLFIWAEWDEAAGKWRLLPQGSFPVHLCMRERNPANRLAVHCSDTW